jgi:AbrB family looped-hinge helix DNA binding protein
MKTGLFMAEIESNNKLTIPQEISDRINLAEGDKVEILLKKIRSRKLDLNIAKNPLYKMLTLSEKK